MSLETYREEDFQQMKRMEKAIIDAMLPFSGGTDPLLGVMALIRCARVMLRAGSKSAQKQLLPVLVAYLSGRMRPSGESSLIWVPGDTVQ